MQAKHKLANLHPYRLKNLPLKSLKKVSIARIGEYKTAPTNRTPNRINRCPCNNSSQIGNNIMRVNIYPGPIVRQENILMRASYIG